MKNKILTALLCILTVLITVTFSIGLPIYFRPFYYAHIDALDLPQRVGLDKAAVKEAYNQVLDYLTMPQNEFSTGQLPYSESGKSHFEDCKVLFDLNITVFIFSLIGIIILFILKRLKLFTPSRPFKKHYTFTAGISTLVIFVLLILIVAVDFDRAFEVFHRLFSPGKDNWMFDPATDPIILIMPEQFFMNCAILIASSTVILSIAQIIYGVKKKRK